MKVLQTNSKKRFRGGAGVIALSVAACLWGLVPAAAADDGDAKVLFKAMSDYLVGQKAIHFTYDASLEVVTEDIQKLTFAFSGSATMARPDKLRFARRPRARSDAVPREGLRVQRDCCGAQHLGSHG